jgi:hypothetical protein
MIYTLKTVQAAQAAAARLFGKARADGIPYILCAAAHADAAQTEQAAIGAFSADFAVLDTADPGFPVTPLTVSAAQTAEQAHHGQRDLTGMPYILHPAHVAAELKDEFTAAAALLHDVAEDTAVTLDDLAEQFPARVMAVLRLLTHAHGEDYAAYVTRLREHPDARAVKLADLHHNTDESRILPGTVSDEQLAKWRAKYRTALAILN